MKAIKFSKSNGIPILEECKHRTIREIADMFAVFEKMGGTWYAVKTNDDDDLDMHTWEELKREYAFVTAGDRELVTAQWVEVKPIEIEDPPADGPES